MAKIKKDAAPEMWIEPEMQNLVSTKLTSRHYAYLVGQVKENGWLHTPPIDDINRRFIKLDKSFIKQLSQDNGALSEHPEYLLREKMKNSCESLLSCEPDAISLEVTDEGSIFYTWKKSEISIYLDHYLIEEYGGKDEAIVSIYKSNNKVLDFAGSLDETIVQINRALTSESIVFPSFA